MPLQHATSPAREQAWGRGIKPKVSARKLALCGAALAVGIGIGWAVKPAKPAVQLHARLRVPVINAHLADAPPGFVFLAGDSHMELASPAIRLCGREVVNGGIGGARSSTYAGLVDQLRFVTRPGAAVLTIGTNDLLKKDSPRDPKQLDRFEAEVTSIVSALRRQAELVVVTAVPPAGRAIADKIEGGVPALYSDRLRSLCTRIGCRFADPFASLRGDDGFGAPGEMPDGLHFARYRAPLARLEPLLCGELATR